MDTCKPRRCRQARATALGDDPSLNRTKEVTHAEVEYRPPLEILAELRIIEQEILQGIEELEGMLR